MIQENTQIQQIGFLHLDHLVLDHLTSQTHLQNFALDIVIKPAESILFKLHQAHDILNFINNEETLDLFFFFFQKQSLSFFF